MYYSSEMRSVAVTVHCDNNLLIFSQNPGRNHTSSRYSEELPLTFGCTHSMMSLEYLLYDSSSSSSSSPSCRLWRSISLSSHFHISVSISSFCWPWDQNLNIFLFLAKETEKKEVYEHKIHSLEQHIQVYSDSDKANMYSELKLEALEFCIPNPFLC